MMKLKQQPLREAKDNTIGDVIGIKCLTMSLRPRDERGNGMTFPATWRHEPELETSRRARPSDTQERRIQTLAKSILAKYSVVYFILLIISMINFQ